MLATQLLGQHCETAQYSDQRTARAQALLKVVGSLPGKIKTVQQWIEYKSHGARLVNHLTLSPIRAVFLFEDYLPQLGGRRRLEDGQ